MSAPVATIRLPLALGPDAMAALAAEVTETAAGGAAAALVLTGSGKVFSAGADLSALSGFDAAALGDVMVEQIGALARALRDCAVPTVAAVNGAVAGAGLGVAVMCDVMIAARSAKFLMPFGRLGLIPDAGLTRILPAIMGEARARAWMMSGKTLNADEARDAGLVWSVHEDDALEADAKTLAARLAGAPSAVLIRQAVERGRDASWRDQVAWEAARQAERLADPETLALIAATGKA